MNDASSVRLEYYHYTSIEARDVYYRVNQPRSLNGRYDSKQQVPPEPVRSQMMNPRTPRYTRRNQKSVDIEEVENAGSGWRKPSAGIHIMIILQGRVWSYDEGRLSKSRLTAQLLMDGRLVQRLAGADVNLTDDQMSQIAAE